MAKKNSLSAPKSASSKPPLAPAPPREERLLIYDGKPLAGSDWHQLKIDRPRPGNGGSMHLESADAAIPHWRPLPWRDEKGKLHQGLEFIASGSVSQVIAVVTRPARG